MELLFTNGRIVLPQGVEDKDVLVRNGVIVGIDAPGSLKGDNVINLRGKYLLPGAIDVHTHFEMPSPWGPTVDDFSHGTKCALTGGVTTIIDFAEADSSDQTPLDVLRNRSQLARGRCYTDYCFHVVIDGNYYGNETIWGKLLQKGVSSFKIFTTYGKQALSGEKLERLFSWSGQHQVLIMAHAEDAELLLTAADELLQKGQQSMSYFPRSRPAAAEAEAVRKLAELAVLYGAKLYIAHVSSAETVRMLEQYRTSGFITGETCPQYLLLEEKVFSQREGGLYTACPPLRRGKDRHALWQALKQGDLKVASTDHCAYFKEMKLQSKTWQEIPAGMPGVETLLPLIYTYGLKEGLGLEQICNILSANPAKLFGLYPKKGVVAPGSDADLVVFNPKKEVRLSASKLRSKAGYTPFEGIKVKGYPEATYLRGNLVCQHGDVQEEPTGKYLIRKIGQYQP